MTNFAEASYKAEGSTATRTLGARAAYWKNVRDFGAIGDGVTDDTVAIQNTVNWTSGANRGTIYFPPGTYKTTAPITFNYDGALSIIFRGELGLSTITGNFSGFILSRIITPYNATGGIRVIEKLTIVNGHAAGGGIKLGSTVGGSIRDCHISAWQGIHAVNNDNGGGDQSVNINSCILQSGGLGGASNGVVVGGNGTVQDCDFNGFDTAIRAYGVGVCIQGCRIEVNNTGILLGRTIDNTDFSLNGFSVLGCSFESNGTAINFDGSCSIFVIGGLAINGYEGAAPGGGNPQYGIRIQANKGTWGTFSGIGVGGEFQVASISVGNTTLRGGLVFNGVHVNNNSTLGGVTWELPTTAMTAEWINCDVLPTWTFSQLPTVSGSNLLEGHQYYITDANQATLGGTVTAGGAPNTHGYVTWNGTNWTLTSK